MFESPKDARNRLRDGEFVAGKIQSSQGKGGDALRVFVTGGGSGGHVIPNLPIISRLKADGWKVYYLGSKDGIERGIICAAGVEFFPIECGKFRRYWSIKNVTEPFRLMFGLAQALILFSELRPHVVFSKGGYVTVPVVIAAWLCRVPLILHESDITPGLANRFAARFAKVICTTFEETRELFARTSRSQARVTGMPLRESISRGDPEQGRSLCGFDESCPVLLIMGGSLGSDRVNEVVEAALPRLISSYQVVHLTGKGKKLKLAQEVSRYKRFEFSEDIHHLLAMANVVVSRAGATAIIELLAARKLNILLPLSADSGRGEQIENANYCTQKAVSCVVYDEHLSGERIAETVPQVLADRERYSIALKQLNIEDGTEEICALVAMLAWNKDKTLERVPRGGNRDGELPIERSADARGCRHEPVPLGTLGSSLSHAYVFANRFLRHRNH